MKQQLKSMTELASGLDTLQVSLGVDTKARKLKAEFTIKAKPNTQLYRRMEANRPKKNRFARFRIPGAVFYSVSTTAVSESDRANVLASVASYRDVALATVDAEEMPGRQKRVYRKLVELMASSIESMARSGKIDFGAVCLAKSRDCEFLAGANIHNAKKYEDWMRDLVAQWPRNAPDRPTARYNVANIDGVAFHTLTFPLPPAASSQSKSFQDLVGDKLTLAVGIGADRLYFGMGRDPVTALKPLLASGTNDPVEKPVLNETSLALRPLLMLISPLLPDEHMEKAIELSVLISRYRGNDRVLIQAEPVTGGAKFQITLDEGVLALIGGLPD
jgi:hypothetical protein